MTLTRVKSPWDSSSMKLVVSLIKSCCGEYQMLWDTILSINCRQNQFDIHNKALRKGLM